MLLKAKVLQANGNRGRAADCYRSALHLDVRCHEAFEALVQHQMLSAAEGESLTVVMATGTVVVGRVVLEYCINCIHL